MSTRSMKDFYEQISPQEESSAVQGLYYTSNSDLSNDDQVNEESDSATSLPGMIQRASSKRINIQSRLFRGLSRKNKTAKKPISTPNSKIFMGTRASQSTLSATTLACGIDENNELNKRDLPPVNMSTTGSIANFIMASSKISPALERRENSTEEEIDYRRMSMSNSLDSLLNRNSMANLDLSPEDAGFYVSQVTIRSDQEHASSRPSLFDMTGIKSGDDIKQNAKKNQNFHFSNKDESDKPKTGHGNLKLRTKQSHSSSHDEIQLHDGSVAVTPLKEKSRHPLSRTKMKGKDKTRRQLSQGSTSEGDMDCVSIAKNGSIGECTDESGTIVRTYAEKKFKKYSGLAVDELCSNDVDMAYERRSLEDWLAILETRDEVDEVADIYAYYKGKDWSDLLESSRLDQITKEERQRNDIIWELLSTEFGYYNHCRIVVKGFMATLAELRAEGYIKTVNTKNMFTNMEQVFEASEIMAGRLHQVLAPNTAVSTNKQLHERKPLSSMRRINETTNTGTAHFSSSEELNTYNDDFEKIDGAICHSDEVSTPSEISPESITPTEPQTGKNATTKVEFMLLEHPSERDSVNKFTSPEIKARSHNIGTLRRTLTSKEKRQSRSLYVDADIVTIGIESLKCPVDYVDFLNPWRVITAFKDLEAITQPLLLYCINHVDSVKFFKTILNKNPDSEFAKIIKWNERQSACERLSLADLLVKPMQRLTKYPLLLSTLRKRCKEDLALCMELDKCVAVCGRVLRKVNEKVRDTDNLATVTALKAQLVLTDNTKIMNLLETQTLNYDGSLSTSSSGRNMELHVYLFNKVLLLTRAIKAGSVGKDKSFIYKQPILLSRLDVSIGSNDDTVHLMYADNSGIHVVNLIAPGIHEAKLWVDNIFKAKARDTLTNIKVSVAFQLVQERISETQSELTPDMENALHTLNGFLHAQES
eukprot:CFRG1611T1